MEIRNRWRRACAFCAAFMGLSGLLVWGQQPSSESKIDQYSAQASRALADRNLPEAEAALQKLAVLTPRSASVQAQLGLVYYLENRYAQAAQSFHKALSLDPQIPNASLMLGICLSETGRYSEAVPLLAPVFRSPPNAQAQRLVGLELLHAYKNLRQFSEADGVAQELLRRYPDDPEIIYHASRLYGDQSLSLILRLMKKAPNSAWVHLVFAQINEDEGRYNSAITQYRLALQIDPHLPGLHFNLGRALLLSSDSNQARDEALKEFEEDLASNPQNSLAEYEIGEIYRREGKLDKALPFFERAIRFNPQFEEAQIALGRSLIGLKQPQQALPHLLAAARLNPNNSVSHFLLARVYEELGNSAAQQREMALFRKYRVQPYSNPNGGAFQAPASFGAPKVTPQVLESNSTK
jgi:tetratricopeptide (TPR) repeat protein